MADNYEVFSVLNFQQMPIGCLCGCKGFFSGIKDEKEVFSCANCHRYLDTEKPVTRGAMFPEAIMQIKDLLTKNRTHYVERNGSLGPGWYSENTDDMTLAEILYAKGFRKVED